MTLVRLIFFLLVTFLTTSFSCLYSNENSIQIQIKQPNGKEAIYYPGDATKLIFQVWPISEVEKNTIINGIKKVPLVNIYVSEVLSAKFSPNNHEVLEVLVNAVVLNSLKGVIDNEMIINNLIIPVRYQKIKFMNSKSMLIEKLIVVKQPVESVFRLSVKTALLLIVICLIFLLFAGKLLNVYLRKRLVLRKRKADFLAAKKILYSADTRSKIEEVYAKQDEWLNYSVNESDAKILLNEINKIMYIRDWDQKTVNLLRSNCNHIGNSLEDV
jgi:hypothetical protein